jgi:hypothetical protein
MVKGSALLAEQVISHRCNTGSCDLRNLAACLGLIRRGEELSLPGAEFETANIRIRDELCATAIGARGSGSSRSLHHGAARVQALYCSGSTGWRRGLKPSTPGIPPFYWACAPSIARDCGVWCGAQKMGGQRRLDTAFCELWTSVPTRFPFRRHVAPPDCLLLLRVIHFGHRREDATSYGSNFGGDILRKWGAWLSARCARTIPSGAPQAAKYLQQHAAYFESGLARRDRI